MKIDPKYVGWHGITQEERFWSKVNICLEDECWEWVGGKSKRGYGSFKMTGWAIPAHRYSYFLSTGHIPTEKECVCHKCDNPPCVNPKHLFLGTQFDNMRDMVEKGRNSDTRGSKNPRAKLSEEDVEKIRKLWDEGISPKNLSEIFNTSKGTINQIVGGNTWRHIGMSQKPPSNRGSKLTEKDILEMRRLSGFGLSDTFIGKMFRLSQPQANKIIKYKSWNNVA
jgi:hypothetical protein